MKQTYAVTDIEAIAKTLLAHTFHKIIRIDGPIGAGKTTLIKAICQALGVKETISSPTFSLVNQYQAGVDTVFHFDFYRIENQDEVADIGIEEYFESGGYCLLEWAEKIESHLPLAYDHFEIEVIRDTQRCLTKKESK